LVEEVEQVPMGQALPEELVKSMENLSNELIESRK
jgi:hypothetical protein